MIGRPTERTYLAELRRILVQRFSISELRTICFDLGIDAESVTVGDFGGGPIKPNLVHGMLDHLEQRRRIPELVTYIRGVRSDLLTELAAYDSKPVGPSPSASPGGHAATPLSDAIERDNRLFAKQWPELAVPYSPQGGLPEPERAWSFDMPGQPMAAPVILGQTCLVASQESGRRSRGAALRAFDLAQGTVLWEHRFEDAVVAGLTRASETQALLSLPSLGGDLPASLDREQASSDSALVAVSPAGQLIWYSELDAHQISAPAAGGGLVVVTGSRRDVLLFDLGTGHELAAVELPVDVALVAPACDREGAYIPCRAPTLLAIDCQGDLRWRYDVEGVLAGVQFNQTPLLVSELVIATLSSGTVVALSRETGALVWEARVGPRSKQLTVPVSDGQRVYVGARDSVVALDLATGRRVWTFQTGVYVTASPVLAGDWLCIAGHDRHLHGLAHHTGTVAWRVALPQEIKTAPALAGGDRNGPYAVVVDCTGSVTSFAYPVPAYEHELARRWEKAAAAWVAAGDARRAAESWIRCAEHAAADAAKHPTEQIVDAQARAWMAAAELFETAGAVGEAAQARHRHAELLGLPDIVAEVRHDGLALSAWSTLVFTVRNRGYGIARNLVIRLAGEQFAWEAGAPSTLSVEIAEMPVLGALAAGQEHTHRVSAQPLAHGDHVPLAVQITYLDRNGEPHRQDETLYLRIARDAVQSIPEILPFAPYAGMAPIVLADTAEVRRSDWGMSLSSGLPPVLDLEIRVGRGSQDYSVELTLGRGAGFPLQVFDGSHMPLSIVEWQPSGDLGRDGRELFEALFRDAAVRKGWHVARGQAEFRDAVRRIRLRIDDAASELCRLPWELLHEDEVMLTAGASTPFSRYIPVDKPWGRSVSTWPIRVLGVVANPRDLLQRYDLAPIDVALEKYILARAFAGIDGQRIRLDFLKPPVTLERLSRAMLRGGYNWLHFIGHTRLNTRQARVDLLMEDDRGATRAIADHLFCRMLAHQGVQPQLVYLSACHSAIGTGDKSLGGLAPKLVEIGVPAVVAMQGRVPVRVAQRAAHIFYAGLVDHGFVDRAMNEARAALLAAELSDVAEPVLYMRLPSGRLWDEA